MKKRTFYWIKNREFPTFAKAKEWCYFHMERGDFKNMEEVTEDGEITKKYIITRTERRVIICKIKDYLEEKKKEFELKQLKLF